MALNEYRLLGRTGLRVSRLCLGTMTFGTEWGWGSAEETARQIYNHFLDSGGNFVDTADGYTNGSSERLIGKFMKERGDRERTVLATKFTFSRQAGDPNAGGNGRKNILSAIDASLQRLQTDYVDLYWLHNWDRVTPAEEVVATLNDLVQQGKIRYFGFSNVPGWYLGRAYTLAEARGIEKPCALQLEYSLVERNIEHEFVPAALELGLGICPWSPLASGLLTGKYRRGQAAVQGEGRLQAVQEMENPAFRKMLDEKNWKIVDQLIAVAEKIGKPPAQVALNWVTNRPGVASTIIGATKLKQLDDNLASPDFTIPQDLLQRLDEVSRPASEYPYIFFQSFLQNMVSGGTSIVRPQSAAAD